MLMQHGTPMLRELSGVDMQLQRNKMESIRIATACIDGLILKPGETFSFWRLVGKPTERRGFRMGFVLKNGKLAQDIGGGLCQMTNLIYWMTIHTDLEVVERWRHGFDVFPDAGRTQPFASGATCAYNYRTPINSASGRRTNGCAAPGVVRRRRHTALRFLRRNTKSGPNGGAAIPGTMNSGATAAMPRAAWCWVKSSLPPITPS
jgi:hypothetical protein